MIPHSDDDPTAAVMATYTDHELLDALLDGYDQMPNSDAPDADLEGIDLYSTITVERTALREAFRRLAEVADSASAQPARPVRPKASNPQPERAR